ncbi:MAG: transposase [Candidatus Methanoculleus thermohydrogenotrophicum]|jgi:putative transposase
MLRKYQYRLYPTKVQETLIAKHPGCCRYMYNRVLARKNQAYHDESVSLSGYDLMKQLPALKEEFPWLKEVNAQSLQQSVSHLSRAFTNFFAGRAEVPTFRVEVREPEPGVHGPTGVYRGLRAGHGEAPEDRRGQSQVPPHLRGGDENAAINIKQFALAGAEQRRSSLWTRSRGGGG